MQCPFCDRRFTGTRAPVALSAHVRFGHKAHARKWSAKLDRFTTAEVPDAQAPEISGKPESHHETQALVRAAYEGIKARREAISAELLHMVALEAEAEALDIQLSKLSEALAVFDNAPAAAAAARHAA